MCRSTHRHSLHCILPPYILSQIAKNGSPELPELVASGKAPQVPVTW